MIPRQVIEEILSGYALSPRGIHGVPHWGRVLENGLRLGALTGADLAVVGLFAVFHDARRTNDEDDPEHGRRGAELAGSLRSLLDVTDAQLALLAHACTHHADGGTEGDVTVRTCWDADRLDLWRVGIIPSDRRLCTDAARDPEIQDWCRVRSVTNRLPDFAAAWLRSR